MVLAGDNYTGFVAGSGRGRDAMPREARERGELSRRGREREGEEAEAG